MIINRTWSFSKGKIIIPELKGFNCRIFAFQSSAKILFTKNLKGASHCHLIDSSPDRSPSQHLRFQYQATFHTAATADHKNSWYHLDLADFKYWEKVTCPKSQASGSNIGTHVFKQATYNGSDGK